MNQTNHISAYFKLEMQEYLLSGNTKLSKLIFQARGRNLDIKMHKRWRYEDVTCVGCEETIENEEELLSCKGFCDENNRHAEKVPYSWLFSDSVSKIQKVAQSLQNRLRVTKKILEEPDCLSTDNTVGIGDESLLWLHVLGS